MISLGGGSAADVAITADPDTPLGDALALVAPELGTRPVQVHGRALSPGTPLAQSGVRDGCVLPEPPQPAVRPPAGTPVLKVVGGVLAGAVIPLFPGTTVVGRGPLPRGLPDHAVSRRHLALTVHPDGRVTAEDLGSSNGTTIEGAALTTPTVVPPGALLWVGGSAVTIGRVPRADAAIEPADDGSLRYNRPPHLRPAARGARVALPAEPDPVPGREWPIAMTLVPLVAGVALAVILRQPEFLLFTLFSPLLLVTSVISDRRKGRKTNRRARHEYAEALRVARQELRDTLAAETTYRRQAAPDPAELVLAAQGPAATVWSRHRSDPAFLELRLGLADLPARTEIHIGRVPAPDRPRLFAVPVTVPLLEVGVLGLAGPPGRVRGLARWIVAQTAVLHSPRDLRIVLLTPSSGRSSWSWLRWLPHMRPDDARSWCLVGNTPDSVAARVQELDELVGRRLATLRSDGPEAVDRLPAVLVVLDGSRALRATPGLAQLLQDGTRVGVVFVCLDEQQTQLPRESGAVVVVGPDEDGDLALRRAGHDDVEKVVPDQLDSAFAETLARALAPLRDADPTITEGTLPTQLRLVSELGLEPIGAEGVLAAWRRAGRTTSFVLGASADGPYVLDLRAGPHALVAGMTGAGKSGLLQTMITSLAAVNRPDSLNFVLIDYKGGAAFRDCRLLPHSVGLVTDLDGPATTRALISLRAELRRREAMLAEAASADLDQYWSRRAAGATGLAPLPRLLLCIDEFAQLVHEVPEFVDGLVDIAARGRSLGIHLVLATQHPAGVVSAQIKANTTIRICLRVADETSSTDVIGIPDAYRMPPLPGRAFVKIGSARPVAIQTARIDGERPGPAASRTPPRADRLSWEDLGAEIPPPPESRPAPGAPTDLSDVVDAIRDAADRLGTAPQRSPWLPPLPEVVLLESLGDDDPFVVPIGLEDFPDEQAQRPAALDLRGGGHLLLCGAPRSGRSSALLTLAGSIGRRLDPADVHIHAIDGGAALQSLATLAHCGSVVLTGEVDRVDRLLGRLLEEIIRRQRRLTARHANDLTELRAVDPTESLPYIVLMLDGYDAFAATFESVDGGRAIADLHTILRDGPRAGIRVVLTGDRSTMVGRVGSMVSDRLVLRLANSADYGMVGVPLRAVGDDPPVGRAIRPTTETAVQIAVLGPDVSGRAQARELTRIAARTAAVGSGDTVRPFRIDPLPDFIGLPEARQLALVPPDAPAFVGVGGDDLSRLGIRLGRDGGTFLVLGGRRTGRSTALQVVAESLVESGHPLVLVTPRPSPLEKLDDPLVRARLTGSACATADIEALLADEPAVVVVDDLEAVADQPLGTALTGLIRRGVGVLLAGSAEAMGNAVRGPALEAGRGGQGVVLCPSSPMPGAVFGPGLRLPRSMVGATVPGRGALLGDGAVTAVQVPLPEAR